MSYINYINYINYISFFYNDHKQQKPKTPSYGTCLGEPLGGFCDVGFVVALHLLFFLIHIFFSTSSLSLPWTIAIFLDSFCTFSSAHRRVIRDTFIFNHSVIFLPRELRFWVGIFYSQASFTLHSFPTFWHNLLLSRLPWDPAVIPWNLQGFILILISQTAHVFVWFTEIHNLLYILNLYLYMSILQNFLLVVKTLMKNIDQQPHHSAAMKI